MDSDDFEQDLCELNHRFGGTHSDRDLLTDEHLRLDLYRRARGGLRVEQLTDLILADPDVVMADAALVELIDHAAAEQSGVAFGAWSSAVLDAAVERRAFPSKRIYEWRLLYSLDDPSSDRLADLIAASDWAQRNAAERTTQGTVLEALAEHGRTKRTRSLAGERLRASGGRGT